MLAPTFVLANTLSISLDGKTKAQLSRTELQAMPATSYTTALPWIKGVSTFTGVELATLLKLTSGIIPDHVTLRALNDYSISINRQDMERYKPIVAYSRDGKPMKIRDKGPYWLIYSLSDFPELDNPQYHSQMIWQLDRIQLD
jgi:hypothetical protein